MSSLMMRRGAVLALALACFLAGCERAQTPAESKQEAVADAPIVPLPQSFSENQFGIPTGEQLQIVRVKDLVATESEHFVTGPREPTAPMTQIGTDLDFWVEFQNAAPGAPRPASALIFYTTTSANLEAGEGDFSGPVGMVGMWRRATSSGMEGVSGMRIEGRTADGASAGAIGSIPVSEFSTEGMAHFTLSGDASGLPSLCEFGPRYIGIVLLGEHGESLSNLIWAPIRVPAACQG